MNDFFNYISVLDPQEGGSQITTQNGIKWDSIERYHFTDDGNIQIVLKSTTEMYRDFKVFEGKKEVIKSVKVNTNVFMLVDDKEAIERFKKRVLSE